MEHYMCIENPTYFCLLKQFNDVRCGKFLMHYNSIEVKVEEISIEICTPWPGYS